MKLTPMGTNNSKTITATPATAQPAVNSMTYSRQNGVQPTQQPAKLFPAPKNSTPEQQIDHIEYAYRTGSNVPELRLIFSCIPSESLRETMKSAGWWYVPVNGLTPAHWCKSDNDNTRQFVKSTFGPEFLTALEQINPSKPTADTRKPDPEQPADYVSQKIQAYREQIDALCAIHNLDKADLLLMIVRDRYLADCNKETYTPLGDNFTPNQHSN